MKITVQRGNDGFGSQFMSILSGIAYSVHNNYEYCHTPLMGIKLLNLDTNQDGELQRANNLIENFVKNLGYNHCSCNDHVMKVVCNNVYFVKPHFHDYIFNNGVDKFYTQKLLNSFSKAYPLEKPSYYNSNFNIAIHIRRGDDIFHPSDIKYRIIDNNVYENIITILQNKYPDAIIHIFSWTDPNLNINTKNIVYHISNSGEYFLNDFNGLVHSDLLVVGSSSFSITAGLLNNKMVLINSELCKLQNTPIPSFWFDNFNNIIGKQNV
jgi:hypothetical protein